MKDSLRWTCAAAAFSMIASAGCSSSKPTVTASAPTVVPPSVAAAHAASMQTGSGMYSADAIRSTIAHNANNPNLTPSERKIMDSEAPPGFQSPQPPTTQ
jgi:hypothetical protein